MKSLFDEVSIKAGKLVTQHYSTSFSLSILLLSKKIRPKIYALYGFVRCADEIVDSFIGYDQKTLLEEFKKNYHLALNRKISVNPILNAFQAIVHTYKLYDLVEDFFTSMEMDLYKTYYQTQEEYEQYIHGSANVVGLMCLKIFTENDENQYQSLKPHAEALGAAFQKVNFLRDYQKDRKILGRTYFPNIIDGELKEYHKEQIIADIEKDFSKALIGIRKLPKNSRFGVFLAFKYYLTLLQKLKLKPILDIKQKRTRISNIYKSYLLLKTFIQYRFNQWY